MTDRVLVLGGTGFVGRHLVKYLVDNDACAKIRVADKVCVMCCDVSLGSVSVLDI